MTQRVKEYVDTCKGCLAAISNTPPVPLQPNLLPDRPWQHLHGDFKGPIGGKYYLHVLIDQYSKFPEVDVLTSTSFEKLRPILDRVFATHGIPEKLTTDNGPPYSSDEMERYAKEMGIELTPVAPNDPQCNGFAENYVKTLCKLIHTCAVEGKDARKELNKFLLQYRAIPHLSTSRSPAEMLYNRRIRTKLPIHQVDSENEDRKGVREQHDSRKREQKRQFDKRHRATAKNIEVGDQVLVKQQKSTTCPPFNPEPLTVTHVRGNRITATNGDITRTRSKNYLKVFKRRPKHLMPSWEKLAAPEQPTSDHFLSVTHDTTAEISVPMAGATTVPHSASDQQQEDIAEPRDDIAAEPQRFQLDE